MRSRIRDTLLLEPCDGSSFPIKACFMAIAICVTIAEATLESRVIRNTRKPNNTRIRIYKSPYTVITYHYKLRKCPKNLIYGVMGQMVFNYSIDA